MTKRKSKKDTTKAILFLESQPPHLGEAFAIFHLLPQFDLLCICVSSKETVLSTEHSIRLWKQLLKDYDNVVICSMEDDFETTTNIPNSFEGFQYFTISQRVYANLSSARYPIELLPTVIGYDSTFLASAFRKARSYNYIKTRSYLRNIKDNY